MENTFAEKLKSARKAAGLTQKSMAEKMLIPRRTLEDWEREINIPPEYIQRLVLNELESLKKEAKMTNEELFKKALIEGVNNQIDKTVGKESIKELRAKTGLTQTEFGKRLGGIPLRTIQNWENGVSAPPKWALELIAFRVENDEDLMPDEGTARYQRKSITQQLDEIVIDPDDKIGQFELAMAKEQHQRNIELLRRTTDVFQKHKEEIRQRRAEQTEKQ